MGFKKGSIALWILFILLIILALGALYYIRTSPKPPPTTVTAEEKAGLKPKKSFTVQELTPEEKEAADNKALNEAMAFGSIGDCEKITYNEELKKQCLDNFNYAGILKSKDEKQCERLNDPALKAECYNQIYFGAAMDSMDTKLCEKITDTALKQNCLNQLQAILGRTAKSAADCETITNAAMKQECLNNYNFTSSVDKLDVKSCDSITDDMMKERCAKTVTQNLEVINLAKEQAAEPRKTTVQVLATCDQLKGDQATSCKDDANFKLAFEKQDLGYCNKITDEQKKNDCLREQGDNLNRFYLRQGVALRNKAFCDKITADDLRILCQNSISQ